MFNVKTIPSSKTQRSVVRLPSNDSKPNKIKAYSLDQILASDPEAINGFSESIKIRGYAYVKLSPALINLIDTAVESVEEFFNYGSAFKKIYSKKPIFGYFDAKHKESFRLLTGQRLNEHLIPHNLDSVKMLVNKSDTMMWKLCRNVAPYLFPGIDQKLKQHNIPLFNTDKYWGMFDITKYKNDGSKTGLNCDAHYDPGLLSIHFRSTEPGLQVMNESGKWMVPPNDKSIGIIWAGDAATKINPQIKPGVHRVTNTGSPVPRIAMWYEVCTAQQEHREMMKTKTEELMESEHNTGIPLSKSMPPDIRSIGPSYPPPDQKTTTWMHQMDLDGSGWIRNPKFVESVPDRFSKKSDYFSVMGNHDDLF